MPPDFGAPVAGRNTPPDGMTQLGNIMNLQRTQQALQSGALQIQQATAMNPLLQRAQQATTNVAERTQQPSIDTATANASNAQALAGQNQQALANQKMAGIASRYAGAINDPMIIAAAKDPGSVNKDALVSTIQKWGYQQAADLGIPREAADNIIAPYMDMAQNNPGGVRQFMKERLLSMLDHSSQVSAINPSGVPVTNNQTSSVVSTNEFGAEKPGQVIPGTQQDIQPSPTAQVVDPNTGQSSMYARPAKPLQPGQPGPVTALGPMDTANIAASAAIRQNANAEAKTYPQAQFNNNQIIKLAQSPNALGEGGHTLSKLGGQWAGIPWTSDMSSNYNNIGHFMGLQAMTQMRAAGLAGTDADKSLSQAVTGSQSYTKDSIINIARVNRALSEGVQLYNQGIERAQSTGNPAAIQSFANKWSSTANVDGFLLYNAKKSAADDPGAWPTVVKEMGGRTAPRYKAALKSVDAMRGLILGTQNGP